jgi:hypothetical protein
MSTQLTKRLTRVALLAGFMLPAAAFLTQPSFAAPAAPPAAAMETAPVAQAPVGATDEETIANFKQVLAQYGKFVELDKYGEVWVPTVTPEGWHPYPPCHWIYAKDVGWYFRDDTPWGAIVHHYGRWSHDATIGWFWVPDADWSPGWVAWRDSDAYTGWAPMPPDQEAQQVSLDTFNKDKMWIFMETPVFLKGCGDTVVASNVYAQTEPVSMFELPRGRVIDVRIVPRWKIKVIRRIVVIDRPCRRRPDEPNNPPGLVPLIPSTHNPPTKMTPADPPPTRTLYNSPDFPRGHRVDRERHRHPVFHPRRVEGKYPKHRVEGKHPKRRVQDKHPIRKVQLGSSQHGVQRFSSQRTNASVGNVNRHTSVQRFHFSGIR